jgi:hypothetical protein
MLRVRRLFWFRELRASVLDFQADITVLRATSIIILTDTIGTRTCITTHTREIHTPIIRRPQCTGTLRIGLITTAITLTIKRPNKVSVETFQSWQRDWESFQITNWMDGFFSAREPRGRWNPNHIKREEARFSYAPTSTAPGGCILQTK